MVEDPVKLGYPGWGSGSISDKDWFALRETIQSEGVKTLLEVGIGLSTLLFQQVVDRLVGYDSLERHLVWMRDKVNGKVELRWWDGKHAFDPGEKFDMAFVDGPQGALNRRPSVQSVLGNCRIFAMHDIGYVWRDKWRHEFDPHGVYEVIHPGGRLSIWLNTQ